MLDTYLNQLDRLCTASGIRLEDAAQQAGVDRNTVYRWRTKRSAPRERVAEKIARTIASFSDAPGTGMAVGGRTQAALPGLRRSPSGGG